VTDVPTQAVRSFGWAGASLVGSRTVVFVTTLVLARLLTPTDFGVVAAGMVLLTFLEMGLDLGIAAALVYEQEKGITPRVQTAFTLNLIVATALTAVGIAAAPLVASFFDLPDYDAMFRVLALYLLVRGVGQVSDALLRRNLQFKRRAVVDITRAVVRAAVAVSLAVAGAAAWSIVAGVLAGETAATIAVLSLARLRPTFGLNRHVARELLRFGVPSTATRVTNEFSTNCDYLVIGNRLGATTLGYYTLAFRLPELLIGNVLWIFSTVAFPTYSRVRTQGRHPLQRTMLRALRLTSLFGFTMGCYLAILSRDVVQVLFSEKWAPAAAPMTLISLAIGVSAVGYASGDMFPALGRPAALLAIDVPITLTLFAGYLLAAPYGMTAVAAVHLALGVVYALIRLIVANRLVGAGTRDTLEALRPAFLVALCVVLAALPVRLALGPGVVALVAITAAAALGVAAGLLLSGPSVRAEIRGVVSALRPRAAVAAR
jgi:PST family polysaccharide transporter